MLLNDKAEFARTLRSLMEREHLTQTALARELGLTSSAVSLWCTGRAYPEVSVLMKLASRFGVSTDYLLTGEITGKDYHSILLKVLKNEFEGKVKISRMFHLDEMPEWQKSHDEYKEYLQSLGVSFDVDDTSNAMPPEG